MAELHQQQGDHAGQRMHPDLTVRPVKSRVHLHKVIGLRDLKRILDDMPVKIQLDDQSRGEGVQSDGGEDYGQGQEGWNGQEGSLVPRSAIHGIEQ